MEHIGGTVSKVMPIRKNVFSDLPQEKQRVVMQMAGPWGCWSFAREAYEAITQQGEKITDGERIMKAGSMADSSLSCLRRCMDMLNQSEDDTISTMEATSKWLLERDYVGLPTPLNSHGIRQRKSAKEMIEDMKRYSKTKSDYEKLNRQQAERTETRR